MAIIVKENLNYIHNHEITNYKYESIEVIGGTIKYNDQEILLITVYKSPNYKLHNSDCLEKLLNKIDEIKLPTIITGDFNLPDINWKNLNSCNHGVEGDFFLQKIAENNLQQIITDITRYKNKDLNDGVMNLPFIEEIHLIDMYDQSVQMQ